MVLMGAMVLYALTAQRGVPWQDSGMHQFRAITFDLTGHLGLALAHPLYIAAGHGIWLIDKGHFPFLMNVFSGIGMAIAMANLAAVCTILTGKRWIGAATATVLAVAHTPWWLGTIAEVYPWTIAGLTAELWLMISLIRKPTWKKLSALAFINGLGWSMHNFALLPLPVYVIVTVVLIARKQLRAKALGLAVAAYLVGAGLYIGLIINEVIRTGDVVASIHSALFGKYASAVLNVSSFGRRWLANAAIGSLNFVNFLLPFAVVGWIKMSSRIGRFTTRAVGAITIIEFLFFVRYPVADQFMFILPSMVMITIAAAVGAAVLVDRSRNWRNLVVSAMLFSVIVPPVVYAVAPSAGRASGITVKRRRSLPFRNEMRYWLVPWKHNENSAERFAQRVLEIVEPNAVIIADSTSYYPLVLVQKIYSLSPGVMILGGNEPWPVPEPVSPEDIRAFFKAVAGRPVYAVSNVRGYCPESIIPYLHEYANGLLYRVRFPQKT